MVGEDDEEPPLRQEKRFLKNQRLKFKVGVVLQHMDLAHKGAGLLLSSGGGGSGVFRGRPITRNSSRLAFARQPPRGRGF